MTGPGESKSFDDLKRLIEEARTTHRELAIGSLLVKFQRYVHQLARSRVAHQRVGFDSFDIQQEVLIDIVNGIRNGKVELRTETDFVGLLNKAVLNKFLDLIKFSKRRRRDVRRERRIALVHPGGGTIGDPEAVDPCDPGPGVSTQVMNREAREKLAETLRALEEIVPPLQYAAFCRRYVDGATIAEIAAEIGNSPKAVKQLLHRARVRVRLELGRSGFDDDQP